MLRAHAYRACGDLVACKCTWNTDTYDPTVATVTGPSVYRKVHIYPLPAIFFFLLFSEVRLVVH